MEERKINGLTYLAGEWPPDGKKPTLLFIHGAGGSARFWENQILALSPHANTLALDLPGHGRSDKPGCETVPDYARRVAAFAEQIQPPRPALVGLSMGGAIVQQILLDYPDRFKNAVLISTGAKLKVLPLIFELLEKNFPAYLELMAKFSASPNTPREKYQAALDDTAAQSPSVIAGDFRACDAFDVRSRLSEIRSRVLVISAEDDKLTPPPYAEFLARNITGAQRLHLLQAGHLVPMEKPDEVNRAILDFLQLP